MYPYQPAKKKEAEESAPVEAGPDEQELVVEWRTFNLVKAGFTIAQANELAENLRVDLHDAIALVKRAGADLAFRVLS